jgi:poly-gamma-glutamate biosynthesis protein PgsC/CapC
VRDYVFRPEVVRVVLVVGVVASVLFYEKLQLTTGGAIVPAYLALALPQPAFALATVAMGYGTYVVVNHGLARRVILYGRRKFEIEVLVGLALVMVFTLVAGRLAAVDPVLLGLAGIGFLVPGILAHDMARQRPGRTLIAVGATTAILGVFLFVYASLLEIAPLAPGPVGSEDLPLPAFAGELFVVGVAVNVVIGMLVFSRLGLRSGGLISGVYIALVAPRWLDLVFLAVVAVATWFVVARLLMPRLLLFGRRKLGAMVLVAAVLGWAAEIAVVAMTDGGYVPWRGLTVMTLMLPALLANDAQRQGWERTAWGAGLTALGTFAFMNVLAGVLKAAGVLG